MRSELGVKSSIVSENVVHHVKFRGDEPDAAAAAAGVHPPVAGAESEFDRLARIGN